jgi:hypothetical protein
VHLAELPKIPQCEIYIYIEGERESLKFDSGKEIKPSTECTYLGTKIDQTGGNTSEI